MLFSSPIDRLISDPHGFGFFQAVRLLDRWLGEGQPPGVGLQKVQFRNSVSLSFPASEIESMQVSWRDPQAVQLPVNIEKVDLTPACMGLLGVTGALPLFDVYVLSDTPDPQLRAAELAAWRDKI